MVYSSVATGSDNPDYLGQMGRILSKSLGYPNITKITGLSGLCEKWRKVRMLAVVRYLSILIKVIIF